MIKIYTLAKRLNSKKNSDSMESSEELEDDPETPTGENGFFSTKVS